MSDGPGKIWMEGTEHWTAEENEIAYLKERLRILERENAELQARIGRLESALSWTLGGHCTDASKILDERPRQSLAFIKSEALREYADEIDDGAMYSAINAAGIHLRSHGSFAIRMRSRADRIERSQGELG